MRVTLDEFRLEHLAPARARIDVLQDEVDAAEAEFDALIEALPYNDQAAAAAEVRLEQRRCDLRRWGRRRAHLESRVSAQVGGWVEV